MQAVLNAIKQTLAVANVSFGIEMSFGHRFEDIFYGRTLTNKRLRLVGIK